MEVHHHPNLHHAPKPWKEYFLEGLMIFLAVFMGFIAETIREGVSDRAKGMEYIRSFVEDMRRDTANFSRLIAFDEKKMEGLNNLSPCFDVIEKNRKSTSCLLPILKSSLYSKGINFADGTMQQLKNAGGFRLLKLGDKDSIIAYDQSMRAYENYQHTAFQESQNNVRSTYSTIANFKAKAMFAGPVKSEAEIPLFYPDNQALVNRLFNDLDFYQAANMQQIKLTKSLKKQATNLINYFEAKYDLE